MEHRRIVYKSDRLEPLRNSGHAQPHRLDHHFHLLAFLSAITFSFYFVFMRMQKDGSPLESILLSHWLTAGVCLIISCFLPAPHVTLKSLLAIAVLGVVQIGVSAILFSIAIRRVSAVQANLIAVIEPVFNPVWVFFAIGEAPGTYALTGGAIIVSTVTITSIISALRKEAAGGFDGAAKEDPGTAPQRHAAGAAPLGT
ncbi:MAG: DMT family transporter [Desulfatiglandales bacterium]